MEDDAEAESGDEDLRAAHSSAVEALAEFTAHPLEDPLESAFASMVSEFFYFADVYLLPGSVSIERIRAAVETGNEVSLDEDEIAAARFLRSVRLDVEDYLVAFNACFGTSIASADLNSQIPRITKRLEVVHGALNPRDVARAWVRERTAGRLTPSEASKQVFESLFERINATLAPEQLVQSKNPAVNLWTNSLRRA